MTIGITDSQKGTRAGGRKAPFLLVDIAQSLAYCFPITYHRAQTMIIGNRRGQHMSKLADENRRLVLDHFLNNPESTIAQAAQECGLSTTSIKTHIKTINAGWRPDGWEGK